MVAIAAGTDTGNNDTNNKKSGTDNAQKPKDASTTSAQKLSQQALNPQDGNVSTVGTGRGSTTDKVAPANVASNGSIDFGATTNRLFDFNAESAPTKAPANATVDNQNHVTSVDLGAGQKRSFTYDNSGQLTSFTEPDGKTYKRDGNDNTKWVGPDNKPADFNQPLVDSQGNLTFVTQTTNQLVVENYDGTTKKNDLKDDHWLTTDLNGRVTSVNSGDKSTQYEYDKQSGDLVKITQPDGSTIQKNAGGQWASNDGPVDVQTPKVNDDGSLTYKNAAGDTVTATVTGTTELHKQDGSVVISNDKGQITEVDYKNGSKRSFGYDGNTLNSIVETDGKQYKLQGGKWIGPDGQDTGITSASINKQGTYSFQRPEGIVVAKTDGTTESTDISTQPGATLSPEAAKKAAQELHDALDNKSWVVKDDPDTTKILNILGPLNKADMQLVEQQYQSMFNKGDSNALIDHVKDKLSDVDYRRVQALLNREDGRTNDAGQVMVALATANSDKTKGNALLMQEMSQLNALQIEQLKKDFQQNYGESLEDAIAKNKNISDDTKQALPILEKGVDNRTAQDDVKLAHLAVQNKDLNLFGVAVAGDSSEAKAARQFLQNDKDFMSQFQTAFHDQPEQGGRGAALQTPSDWNHTNQIAKDFLQEGHISLATIAQKDTGSLFGWFDNKDNLALACKNASPDERQQFQEGQQLALQNKQPQNDAEKAALDYYHHIDDAFKNAGNDRERSIWEDELLHGRSTLITDLANTHSDGGLFGIGSGHSTNDLMNRVENMNEQNWHLLHDPSTRQQYLDEVQRSLKTYASGDEQKRIIDLLNQKANAGSYQESQNFHRTLFDTINDNKGSVFLGLGTSYDTKNIVGNIEHLSPDEAKKYKEDQTYRNQVDSFIKDHMDGATQAYAKMLLADVAQSGQPPKIGPDEKILQDKVNGVASPQAMADIRDALQNQDFRTLMQKPDNELNEQQKAIKQALVDQVFAGSQNYLSSRSGGYADTPDSQIFKNEVLNPLLRDGHLAPSIELQMDLPKPTVYADIAAAQPDEQKKALDMLHGEERKIAENVVKQGGKMELADQVAQYVSSGGDNTAIKDQLKNMSEVDLEKVKISYAEKYGKDLDADLLGKVPESDRQVWKDLLTTQHTDGRQDFYDNLINANFSGVSPDGSQLTAEKANETYQSALADYQSKYQTLPKDVQQQLDQYFGTAMQQYKDSKAKLAEIAVDAAITAAAVTAVIASGGTLGPAAIALMATGAAAFRVGTMKAIEGDDFNGSPENVVKQAAIGFTSFALNTLGPEMFSAGGPLLSGAVDSTVAGLGTTALKEGGETALRSLVKDGLQSGAIDDSAVTKFAAQYLKDASPEEVSAFRQSLKTSFDTSQTGMRTEMQQLAESQAQQWAEKTTGEKFVWQAGQLVKESAQNAAIGAGANVVSDLVVAPFTPGGINPQQLLDSALSGAGAGAGMTILLKPFAFGASKIAENFKGATVGDEPNAGIPVNVVKGQDGGLYIDPKNNLPGYEITRKDGTRIKIEGDQPIKIEQGDQLTNAPQNVKVETNPDGTSNITDGQHKAPIDVGAVGDRSPQNVFANEQQGFFGRLKQAIGDTWKGLWDQKPVLPSFNGAQDVAISINGRDYNFGPDGKLNIGREITPTLNSSQYVSRNQGTLEYRDGKIYYTDNGSTNGSFIQQAGSTEWRPIEAGKPIEVGPNDQIRLGGINGQPLDIFPKNAGPEHYDISLNGSFLQPGPDGSIPIGRGLPGMQDSGNDALSKLVSRDQGALRQDPASKQFYFEDHNSGNGTFIEKQDGSWVKLDHGQVYSRAAGAPDDQWVLNRAGNSDWIQSGDHIHLGSENGPQLELNADRGRALKDGSYLYRKPEGDWIVKPDGSSAFKNNAGIETFRDSQNHVTETRTPDGKNIEYRYDAQGNMVSTRTQDANGNWTAYQTTDGGKTWWSYQSDANSPSGYSAERFPGKVEVDPGTGSTRLTYDDVTKPVEIKKVDGSSENIYRNGYHEYKPADLATEQAKLKALADHSFGDIAQRDRFLAMARDLEARGLPPEKVAAAYQQIDRLLEGGNAAVLDPTERAKLAEQMMYNAAHPESIDQGNNSTCNVTTVESRMFNRDPALAMQTITDVALTGKYTMADGKVVDIQRTGALNPGQDGSTYNVMNRPFNPSDTGRFPQDVKIDGQRNFADQIFQDTAVNAKYSDATGYWDRSQTPPKWQTLDKDQSIQYVKDPPKGADPGGERLEVIGANGQVLTTAKIGDSPSLAATDLQTVYNKMTPSFTADGYAIPGKESNFILSGVPGDRAAGAIVPTSSDDLISQLQNMKQQGNLPAIAWVDTTKSPQIFGNNHGSHVVLVTAVDPVTRTVTIVNQWGQQFNKTNVPIDELYNSLYR